MEHSNKKQGWYALRVFHQHHERLKSHLEREGIQLYAPMTTEWKEKSGQKYKETKAIGNLLFLYSTQEFILQLRRLNDVFVYCSPGSSLPAEIPEREIEILQRVVEISNGEVEYFEKTELLGKSGVRVEIIDGPFRGMTGILRYVRKKKRVVINVEGICSVVILQHIPPQYIRVIE